MSPKLSAKELSEKRGIYRRELLWIAAMIIAVLCLKNFSTPVAYGLATLAQQPWVNLLTLQIPDIYTTEKTLEFAHFMESIRYAVRFSLGFFGLYGAFVVWRLYRCMGVNSEYVASKAKK